MSHEGFDNYGEQFMTTANRETILQQYEHLYVPANMQDFDAFCGDERPSELEVYLHLFGGGTKITYTYSVVRELLGPGSVTESFPTLVAAQAPTIIRTGGLRYGVHSDDHAEGDMQLDINNPKILNIGCGYLGKRKDISNLIAVRAQDVLLVAQREVPEHFTDREDLNTANGLILAHGNLAERPGFITNGREVARAALNKGAKSMVVRGPHMGKICFINDKEGSTYSTTQAVNEGLPAYDDDTWVARKVFSNMHTLFPYDMRTLMQANYIDTIGTALALGVEPDNIIRRR